MTIATFVWAYKISIKLPKKKDFFIFLSHKGGYMGDMELKKPHFVLIHGVCGGSWCWYKIKCLMYNSGYNVTCIDLKSAGIDLSDPNKILSFDDYNKPLIDFMSSLPDQEKVYIYYCKCIK